MKPIYFTVILLILNSCEKDKEQPKYFNTRLYAVHPTSYLWVKNSFFENQPISLQLESRTEYEDRSSEGRFEPINEGTMNISLDRHLITEIDTIKSGTNLLSLGIAEIELYEVKRNNEPVPDSYIIWINRQNKFSYGSNNGYFTVFVKGATENQNQIQDSTVFFAK